VNPIFFSGRSINTPHEIPSALHGRTTFQKPTTALNVVWFCDCLTVVYDLSNSVVSSDLATHDPDFKVAAFFAIKYAKNGARYSHSYYWTLVGSHMRPIERCHFQWPWMTPNPGFKVMVLFKGEYYSERRILYCPTADNLSYLTSNTMCRWRTVPQR